MHPRLLAPFAAFERRKHDLLARLAQLDDRRLNHRPQPGAWSLLEVADHLARTEGAVADALHEGLPAAKARRTLKHRVMYRLVLATLALPVRVKVPTNAPGVHPGEELTLDGVGAGWERQRGKLVAELERFGDADMKRMVVRHPIAGPVGPRQTLAFLNVHFDHHLYQVKRIWAQLPAAPG